MNFNIDEICSDFLDYFLTIIEDPEAVNNATFFSGFLRANVLSESKIIDQMSSQGISYIPLSSAVKASLVTSEGFFNDNCVRAQQVGFFIDKPRIQAALNELHA